MSDAVNHPKHYGGVPGIECIEVVEHFPFCRGNAIKYLWRAGAKGDLVEDLRKAIWYIQREIDTVSAASQTSTGVDALPEERRSHTDAQSRSSAAGSSSSPSVAPTDSRPDAKGQEPA